MGSSPGHFPLSVYILYLHTLNARPSKEYRKVPGMFSKTLYLYLSKGSFKTKSNTLLKQVFKNIGQRILTKLAPVYGEKSISMVEATQQLQVNH